MSTSYTFAIIGCQHGHIEMFIREMLALGHTCAGVYEPDRVDYARQIAERYNFPLVSSLDDLFGKSIHIVGCSVKNSEKIDVIELCEKHGTHVMVTKPVVANRDGYNRLEAVVKRGNIQIGTQLTERYQPAFYTLKQMIEREELGEIVTIGMRKPHKTPPADRPSWYFSKEHNGGLIIDLLIHDYDLLRWLTGKEVISSDGYMGKSIFPEHPTFYDHAMMHVLMEGNVMAQLYVDWHTPAKHRAWGDCRAFVVGTKGTAELRTTGDPLISTDPMMIKITDNEPPHQVELQPVTTSVTEDFIKRIERAAESYSAISHHDILLATKATIEADERVKLLSKFAGQA